MEPFEAYKRRRIREYPTRKGLAGRGPDCTHRRKARRTQEEGDRVERDAETQTDSRFKKYRTKEMMAKLPAPLVYHTSRFLLFFFVHFHVCIFPARCFPQYQLLLFSLP